MLLLRRGNWVDQAITWLADKPLPEDDRQPPRWAEGTTLGDLILFSAVGRHWSIDWSAADPKVSTSDAYELLLGELDDGIAILADIAAEIDDDLDPAHRPTLRATKRIRAKLAALEPAAR